MLYLVDNSLFSALFTVQGLYLPHYATICGRGQQESLTLDLELLDLPTNRHNSPEHAFHWSPAVLTHVLLALMFSISERMVPTNMAKRTCGGLVERVAVSILHCRWLATRL